MGRPPKDKKGARKGTSVRLSARDEWFIEALIDQDIYGENTTEVLRTALRLLVQKAQDIDRRLPKSPKRLAKDIPPAAADD